MCIRDRLRLTARAAGARLGWVDGARARAILGPLPSLLDRALNVGEAKKYKTYQKRVALINAFEAELEHDSDAELRERMDALRARASGGDRSAAQLDALLPECFA